MEYKVYKIIVDVTICVTALLPSVVFFGLESPDLPFQRGLYCDDESIRYPYRDDTISVGLLLAVGLFIPIGSMVVCEWLLYRHFTKMTEEGSSWRPYSRKKLCCCTVHPWASALYATIGPFVLGAAFTLMITDCSKHVIGRLRPHFVSVCEPDWSAVNCTSGDGNNHYVMNIHCLGTDQSKLANARLSFPSGHASSSFYLFIYLVIYLQARMIPEVFGDTMLRPFLQMLGALAAILVSLSRVSDYKHHWSDVLAGSTLGLVVAVLVALYVSDLFKIPVTKEGRIDKGEAMPLYGSGSAISEQISSDSYLLYKKEPQYGLNGKDPRQKEAANYSSD